MAWDYADDEAMLQKMADCGINLVAFVPPAALDACEKVGVKAIVFEEGIGYSKYNSAHDGDQAAAKWVELIGRVNDHPAVYGYHIKDEPNESEFPELAKSVAVIREHAPGKWPYINLLPSVFPNYDNHLNQFVKVCNPTAISYDRYSYSEDGGFHDTFWGNLAQVRNASIRHDLPFWNIILTTAHGNYGEVTPTILRMQVFGSLLYGARGISYYKFISREVPILQAPDLGNWRSGPLDEFGEKTPLWSALRNLNRQVQNLAGPLLRLKSDRVYHIGSVPPENQGVADDSLVKGMKIGANWAVGEFTHEEDGSRWVMLLNKDQFSSHLCKPEFRTPPAKVEYCNPIAGDMRPFLDELHYLAPGQAVLIKLTAAE